MRFLLLSIALLSYCSSFAEIEGRVVNDSIKIVNDIDFVWETDDFSKQEKIRTKRLLKELGYETQKLLGKYPFTLKFYVKKRNSSSGPLVGCRAKFGETVRGVYLSINLNFSDEDILESWKMPHEVSHLALPGLGRENSWFYEGFATFMSRQIMTNMGYYSDEELEQMYQEKFEEISDDFDKEGTFLSVIRKMPASWNYKSFYWGGATFFYRADKELRKNHNTTMCELIKEYQKQERKDDRTLLMVIKSWDRIVGEELFSRQMREYRNRKASYVFNRHDIHNE